MGKWIRRIIMLAVLAVFLFSVTSIVMILRQYEESDRLYSQIAEQYTTYTSRDGSQGAGTQDAGAADGQEAPEAAPISVDFQGLQAVNGDV